MTWKTMEEGIQCLREMALLEILFEKDEQPSHNPDDVRCTSQMWRSLSQQGPPVNTNFLASLHFEGNRETVGSVMNKLRMFDSMVHTPLRAHISTIETMVESLKALTTEVPDEQKKLRGDEGKQLPHGTSATRASEVRAR
ncbi:hypothetical protein BTVI_59662 [Pitangus sulphuratus]|nr:hypothetical protein BTVI_59662 [Pitangus sulphuratus]